jgi:hypothetical protein
MKIRKKAGSTLGEQAICLNAFLVADLGLQD